jgi:predicted Zn-dependent protease
MKDHRLAITTIGAIESDPRLPEWLAAELPTELKLSVLSLPPLPLLGSWRDPATSRIRSNAIVDALAPRATAGWTLALIDEDLAAPGRDFLFGEATFGGPFAVVGLARLRADDPALLRLRTLKEAVHEIGHLASLPHCPEPRCVMSGSATLREVDLKLASFCDKCLGRYSAYTP